MAPLFVFVFDVLSSGLELAGEDGLELEGLEGSELDGLEEGEVDVGLEGPVDSGAGARDCAVRGSKVSLDCCTWTVGVWWVSGK